MWSKMPIIVYPSCGNIENFQKFLGTARHPWILSIGQYRPEKNHLLQLKAFHWLIQNYESELKELIGSLKLIIVGSCRNKGDEDRVKELKKQANLLGISQYVEIIVNASFETIEHYLEHSLIGIHTMYKEHFGISIVEMMAAGLIVIANNSGGPKEDIIQTDTGFLAMTMEEYGKNIYKILQLTEEERNLMQIHASESVRNRFSDSEFAAQFISACQDMF